MLRRFLISTVLCLSLGACKQGEGEVCQIDDDCEDGLVCATGRDGLEVCQTSSTGAIDAGTPRIDAAPTSADAAVPDAVSPDAAAPDAAAPDAAAPDAAVGPPDGAL